MVKPEKTIRTVDLENGESVDLDIDIEIHRLTVLEINRPNRFFRFNHFLLPSLPLSFCSCDRILPGS